MRLAGVGYLPWLAWDAWDDARETSPGAFDGHAPPLQRYFRRGLIINTLNPKAAVFYVAILPTFIDPAGATMRQAIALTVVYVTIATVIHLSIVTLAGAARPLLENPALSRIVRRAMAILLVLIALWFAISARMP